MPFWSPPWEQPVAPARALPRAGRRATPRRRARGRAGPFAAAATGTAYSSFSGYFAEYDASNSASITQSGGLVSQWNDLSTNAYHVTQATGASQPTTGARTIGGLNALDFTDDRLSVDIPDTAQPLTVYFVLQSDVTTDSTPTKYEFLGGDPSVGGTDMGHIFDEWTAGNLESLIGVDGTAHIIGAVYNGASSVIWVDSTEVTGDAGSGGLNKIHIGNRGNDAAAFNGGIGHCLIYTSAHDATTRGNVRTALKSQWSTP